MAERYQGILSENGGDAGDAPIVNPADYSGDDGSGTGGAGGSGEQPSGRPRGRPRGSRNRNSARGGAKRTTGGGARAGTTKATLDIDGISALLVMIHKAAQDRAQTFDENGLPIWEIQKSEGDALAEAANRVIRHYDIAASQKMIDIGFMMTTAFAVYMPRVAATVEAKQRGIPTAQRVAA